MDSTPSLMLFSVYMIHTCVEYFLSYLMIYYARIIITTNNIMAAVFNL